jgi:hypothetical protein
LEFWWNPQKIFQAMSRVDRMNQRRDVFIYLLCYNDNGEMIDEERIYFETMNRKFENAKILYQENNKDLVMYDECGDKIDTLYKEMPDKKIFKKKDSFSPDLNIFLSGYNHKTLPSLQVMEAIGIPLNQTKNQLARIAQEHIFNRQIISSYPWRILLQELEDHFFKYYQVMLSNNIKSKINDRLKTQCDIRMNRKIDSFYPIVFAGYIRLSVKTVKNKAHLFIVGINKNRIKELLGIWNPLSYGLKEAFDDLKKRGLSSILIVIVNSISAIEEIKSIYPDTLVQLSFSEFIIDFTPLGRHC